MANGGSRRGGNGGWTNSDSTALNFRAREYLSEHAGRAPTTFIAKALGAGRDATYDVLTQLHADRLVTRRTDDRGRVWWGARTDVGLTRKERILFALERVATGELSTSQLCRAFGERDIRRGYQVLDYYRTVGLLETVSEGVGTEAVWRVRE
jgi:hypothetical protein